MTLTDPTLNTLLMGALGLAALLILLSLIKRKSPSSRIEQPTQAEPKVGTVETSFAAPTQIEALTPFVSDVSHPAPKPKRKQVLSLYVMAKKPYRFTGYDLLQVLQGNGCRFGKMQIFHYVDEERTLFSISSATEPGTFNLDNMGVFSCPGLSLFMTTGDDDRVEENLATMIEFAKQIADELDGELFDYRFQVWNDAIEEAYFTALQSAVFS